MFSPSQRNILHQPKTWQRINWFHSIKFVFPMKFGIRWRPFMSRKQIIDRQLLIIIPSRASIINWAANRFQRYRSRRIRGNSYSAHVIFKLFPTRKSIKNIKSSLATEMTLIVTYYPEQNVPLLGHWKSFIWYSFYQLIYIEDKLFTK